MNFNFEKVPEKKPASIIDIMTLDDEILELLPGVEKTWEEVENGIRRGKTLASEILRETKAVDRIHNVKDNALLLDKTPILGFFYANQSAFDKHGAVFAEIEKFIEHYKKRGGYYNVKEDKIRILVDRERVIEQNNFAQVELLSAGIHETLHALSKRSVEDECVQSGLSFHYPNEKTNKLDWLNEAVTEKLTQNVITDIVDNSPEWQEKFFQLTEDEEVEIRWATYCVERKALSDLVEKMMDECSRYKDLPGSSYRERLQKMEIVFKENFAKPYINGDIFLLESNLKELGYDSVFELDALNPNPDSD